MAEPTPLERPRFVIDTVDFHGDNNHELRIHGVERAIHRKPEAYLAALTDLGATATAATISRSERGQQPDKLKSDPRSRLLEYFTLRYDESVDYDPPTEEALLESESWQSLREQQRNSRLHSAGVSRNELGGNRRGEHLRDEMRRTRLAFYIQRVVAWKASESSATRRSQLPSAG